MSLRRKVENLEPTKVPTNIDIAWAAGVWEGEGSCSTHNKRRATVVVTQKDPEILYRLRDWFGGSVLGKKGINERCFVWLACGDRGRFFIALIYPFLSTRRRVQVDASQMLSYLGDANPSDLDYQEIWNLLESRPARKRRSDALTETPEERKARLCANSMRFYWKHRPQVLATRSVSRASAKSAVDAEQAPAERLM
jgi:hypothetical protein